MSKQPESSGPDAQKRDRVLRRLLAKADRLLEHASHVSNQFSRWRMAIFISGALVSVAAFKLALFHLGNGLVAAFVLTFLVVAWHHSKLEDRMHRLRLWRGIKASHLARLELNWPAIPKTASPVVESHPYATDLDVVGPHSMFTLVNTTVSTHGHDRLAAWLIDQNVRPPDFDTWLARQSLVKELAGLPLFRDRLALEASLIGEGDIDGHRILEVLRAPAGFSGLLPVLLVQTLLAGCTITLALASALGALPAYWPLTFGAYLIIYLLSSGRVASAFSRVLSLHIQLEKLGAIFRYIQRRSMSRAPSLEKLCAPVRRAEHLPAEYVRSFARVAHALSVRAHPLVHLGLNALIPWDHFWAYRLDCLQRLALPELPKWLEVLAELEAASALGTFAYLNPGYCWPTLAQSAQNGQRATLDAGSIAHPLIASSQRVANDIELRGLGRILLITGSNMSGKSTFLRTVGLNTCLAQAGAPVCAASFHASWVRIYSCIRVDDSLEAGLSYFYAEVKRLRRLMEAASDHSAPPVLFLIDEIFKGTNNRERIIGSRSFIKALAASNGFGLVTTHDLELAEMETDIQTVSNVHFEETVTDKALKFDYMLRKGPCPTTNALRIMALEGLPVPDGIDPGSA